MNTILNLGFILLAGLLAERLIQKIKLPTVTAFILVGILLGPSLLNLVNDQLITSSGLISDVSIAISAFEGGIYGSSIPVNPFIFPERALV